jgi:O-antigen ligase
LATDNDYLRAIGETGLLGLLAFLSVLFGLYKSLHCRIKNAKGLDKIIVVSGLGILGFFLVTSLFLDVFEASKIAILFWAYMGLAISIKTT